MHKPRNQPTQFSLLNNWLIVTQPYFWPIKSNSWKTAPSNRSTIPSWIPVPLIFILRGICWFVYIYWLLRQVISNFFNDQSKYLAVEFVLNIWIEKIKENYIYLRCLVKFDSILKLSFVSLIPHAFAKSLVQKCDYRIRIGICCWFYKYKQ